MHHRKNHHHHTHSASATLKMAIHKANATPIPVNHVRRDKKSSRSSKQKKTTLNSANDSIANSKVTDKKTATTTTTTTTSIKVIRKEIKQLQCESITDTSDEQSDKFSKCTKQQNPQNFVISRLKNEQYSEQSEQSDSNSNNEYNDDKQSVLSVDSHFEYKYSDEECVKILIQLDPNGNLSREDIIDKLETLLFNTRLQIKTLKHQIKGSSGSRNPSIQDKYSILIRERCRRVVIKRILSDLKVKDIEIKKTELTEQREKINIEIKTTEKLPQEVFVKRIDLTLPKNEREPDPNTKLWKERHDFCKKNNKYLDVNKDKEEEFKRKIQPKALPVELKKDILDKITDNSLKFNIHKNHAKLLRYQKYDPTTYTGLTIF